MRPPPGAKRRIFPDRPHAYSVLGCISHPSTSRKTCLTWCGVSQCIHKNTAGIRDFAPHKAPFFSTSFVDLWKSPFRPLPIPTYPRLTRPPPRLTRPLPDLPDPYPTYPTPPKITRPPPRFTRPPSKGGEAPTPFATAFPAGFLGGLPHLPDPSLSTFICPLCSPSPPLPIPYPPPFSFFHFGN
jgi:hypothetical protein